MEDAPHGIIVLGLGNPVMSDDAVGLHVAAELDRLLALDPLPGVVIETSTRAGFELIDLLSPYSHAIIVDAISVPDKQPGRLRQLTLQSFAGSARLVNQHELSVSMAFELAHRLEIRMPEDVEIYAVEAGDVYTISESLTEAVALAVKPLAELLHSKLKNMAGAADGRYRDSAKRSFYDPFAE